jgi:hypothetical protein
MVPAVAGSVFIAARPRRLRFGDDYPGDDYGHLQAAALAGAYVALNVQLSAGSYTVGGWFYWCTYITTWILPIAGLLESSAVDVEALPRDFWLR